jgi:hypothetical protein
MLRFSDAQFSAFEERAHDAMADRFRPALKREFGPTAVAACEPLSDAVRAGFVAKFDEPFEVYRFMRVLCALEADRASANRWSLTMQIAMLSIPVEARLHRMERAARPASLDPAWEKHVVDIVSTGR